MFDDDIIQKWILEKGRATSFTFLIYGDLTDEQSEVLIRGLSFFLEINGSDSEMVASTEKIDEKRAVAWNTFQGTSLSIIFGGDRLSLEEHIIEVITDGLNYLRFKYDYLGSNLSDSHV